MKNKLFLATLLIICGMSSSCDKDPEEDVTINNRENNEEALYDRSENGFFIDGETKLLGYFEDERVIEGFVKYVKCTAVKHTDDGGEQEVTLGYNLVWSLNGLARMFSDQITYNADSTSITCLGNLTFDGDDNIYSAKITASITPTGKPHLIMCYANLDAKPLKMQFRQTYTQIQYAEEIDFPDVEEWIIK